MSASHLIETWEHGRAEDPPALLSTLLRDDERLLWAARLNSAALAFYHARLGLLFLFFAGLFAFWAPWRESLQDYCSGDRSKCNLVYYMIWPFVLYSAANALVNLWRFQKSKFSPNVLGYAVTTTRAISLDESRPWDARSVYLDLHPIKAGPVSLEFQGSRAVRFIGLDDRLSTRATYWATEGRRIVRAKEETS